MSSCHCIITRFSYRFRKTDPTDKLLSDKRLDERIKLHEKFCYSSIVNQLNPNFYWILIIDPLLPEKYRSQLEELIQRHKKSENYQKKGPREIWLHTWDWDQNNLGKLDWVFPYFDQLSQKNGNNWEKPKYFVTTRLDDDDSLVETFVDQVKTQVRKRPFIKGFRYLSFSVGYHYYVGHSSLRMTRLPMIALGLTLVAEISKYPLCVYMGSHTRIPTYIKDPNRHATMLEYYKKNKDLPVNRRQIMDRLFVIRGGTPVWIRNVHEFNLQKNITKHYSKKQNHVKIKEILSKQFHIDI